MFSADVSVLFGNEMKPFYWLEMTLVRKLTNRGFMDFVNLMGRFFFERPNMPKVQIFKGTVSRFPLFFLRTPRFLSNPEKVYHHLMFAD